MKFAECEEATAANIEVVEACKQLVREGDPGMTAHIQEQLHVLHRVVEEDQTQAKGNKLRRRMNKWGKQRLGTKTPAGARANIARYREIRNMTLEEFKNPSDRHPKRKISKTRYKAVCCLDHELRPKSKP